jgi:ABC-type multidrug transport system fused ATPase/permease subunit
MKKREDIKREINTLKFVWEMAKGEHAKIIVVIFLNILSGTLPAAIAWFLKNYFNDNSLNFNFLIQQEELILFVGIIVCGIFLQMITKLIMGYTMLNIKRNIEISCVKKISTLPHSYISDCIDNRIIMTLSIESNMLTSLIPMVYRSFIKAPVTILGFVVVLMLVSPMLTLVCMCLILTVVAGVLLFRKTIKRLNKTSYNRIGDLHNYFSEWLSGYRVFIASNAAHFIENQLMDVSKELSGLSKKLAKISTIQSLIIEILTISVTILFVIIATRQTVSHTLLNISELILFPAAILFIRGEVLNVIYGYMQLAGTESAAKRIIDVMEYPVVKNISAQNNFTEKINSLTLKNLSFSYKKTEKMVLDNVNIRFERGKIHTIIGRSGAGKTTFVNLCMRLRQPDIGTILYNEHDISAFPENNLLDKISLVEQEPFIFEGTIAENIFFDKQPDTDYALKLLEEFELTHLAKDEAEFFNIRIGKKERQLSTGEKQRIALIRVLVKKTDVVFFDEVTGNLDAFNSEKIIDCIKEIAKEKIVICVSHDLMLIQASDMLYEIINGKIVCKTH